MNQMVYLHDINGEVTGVNFLHVARYHAVHNYQDMKTRIVFAIGVRAPFGDELLVRETVDEIRALLFAVRHPMFQQPK